MRIDEVADVLDALKLDDLGSSPERMELLEISSALRDKEIHVMPYSHADYAWRHTRKWHELRYLAIFDKVMSLLESHEKYRFFFDSISEMVLPCVEKRPASRERLRQAVKSGRLEFCGGQWSNVRPTQVGDETFIRNITVGREALREICPEASPSVYANLDVCVGHSQMPQLLRLGGYRRYFAWRPEKGLDRQGVPRRLVWRGLSEAEVTVARHCYGGWSHPADFMGTYDDDYHKNPKIDFTATVLQTWRTFIKRPTLEGLRVVSFCQGGDDSMPNGDLLYGFEWDVFGLVAAWNAAGRFGRVRFATPGEMFAALEKEKLPLVSGVIDPCDVGFNLAYNGANGAWRLREAADRALLQAETLAALASLRGFEYPEAEFRSLWKKQLSFCTHAVEMLFDEDFAEARSTLDGAVRGAAMIAGQAVAALVDDSEELLAESYCVFNPLPESRTEFVHLSIPNVIHGCRQPLIKDHCGRKLPMQVIETGSCQRHFEVVAEVPLHAGGLTELKVEWSDRIDATQRPADIQGMDLVIRSDTLELEFSKGMLTRIENVANGQKVVAFDGASLLEPSHVPQKSVSWMTTELAGEPTPFEPTSLTVEFAGELLTRIVRKGKSGPHLVKQAFDLCRGRTEVAVETAVDIVSDCACVCLGMPLRADASLHVDIPFGVEPRELSGITYGSTAGTVIGDAGENIERLVPGVFWGRSWMFCAAPGSSFGLISVDGSKYYRDFGGPRRLLNFLASIRPDDQTGDFIRTDFQRARGWNVFHHVLTLDEADWRGARMVARAQRWRTPPAVFPGSHSDRKLHVFEGNKKPTTQDQIMRTVRPGITNPTSAGETPDRVAGKLRIIGECGGFEVSPEQVRLSTFHRRGDSFILRLANLGGEPTATRVRLPFTIADLTKTDLLGDPLPSSFIESDVPQTAMKNKKAPHHCKEGRSPDERTADISGCGVPIGSKIRCGELRASPASQIEGGTFGATLAPWEIATFQMRVAKASRKGDMG